MTGQSSPRDDLAETVSVLSEVLGPSLVAVIAGVTTEAMSSWVSGVSVPDPDQLHALTGTRAIIDELLTVDSASVVRAWVMGENPLLDDASPAEVIAAGRLRYAATAAHAFAQGG